ncbi:MAG: hypothetical protein IK066_04485, partial [Kiritimatiellae bacterium]|nr:hypothetical protein [Kiritimatiellia bacterium]
TGRWTAVLPATVPAGWAGAAGGEFPLAKAPEPCGVCRFAGVEWRRGGKAMEAARYGAFGFRREGGGWKIVDNWGLVRDGDALGAVAVLEPASTGYELEEVPEDVAGDLSGLVAARASALLLSMPNAAWSDAAAAQRAAWEAQRELGIATSRMNGDFAGGSRVVGCLDQ